MDCDEIDLVFDGNEHFLFIIVQSKMQNKYFLEL